eukprot:240341-Chlamydomonas_euryale.AAC.4
MHADSASEGGRRSRSRMGGRYGSRLLRSGLDAQYARMQGVLGATPQAVSPERITVSILQTLKYLDLPPEYKSQLAAYRAAALGADLAPLLAKTRAILANEKQDKAES